MGMARVRGRSGKHLRGQAYRAGVRMATRPYGTVLRAAVAWRSATILSNSSCSGVSRRGLSRVRGCRGVSPECVRARPRRQCRSPVSRAACVTQLRIVCARGSNSFASCSGGRAARARSISCWRNSGGYLRLVRGIEHSRSPKGEVSAEPGQLHSTLRPESVATERSTKRKSRQWELLQRRHH